MTSLKSDFSRLPLHSPFLPSSWRQRKWKMQTHIKTHFNMKSVQTTSRLQRELANPAPKGSRHDQALRITGMMWRQGITADAIFAQLRQTYASDMPDKEIRDIINWSIGANTTLSLPQNKSMKPRFDPKAFLAKCMAEGSGIDEVDVWESSPIRLDGEPGKDATLLLETLYKPTDILFIGEQYGTVVNPVSKWLDDFKSSKPLPPHIMPNPLTGQEGLTQDGKPSFRADACVQSFRFAVAEFDNLSREDQLRFWWVVDLPVCALIDSGGKSLHAWIQIDGITTADLWSSEVEQKLFKQYLIPLGCDGSCKNESRMSRLPGHRRTETERWQRILFLSPEGRRIKS